MPIATTEMNVIVLDGSNNCVWKIGTKLMKSTPSAFVSVTNSDDRFSRTTASLFIISSPKTLMRAIQTVSEQKLGRRKPVFLVVDDGIPKLSESDVELKIDQEVYLVSLKSKDMIDLYINGILVQSFVGHFTTSSDLLGRVSIRFEQNGNYTPFHKRDNFYGQHLVAMTEQAAPYTMVKPEFETEAKFFPENQTYDVTDFHEGMYNGILLQMSQELNFTYRLYKRKDRVWGGVVNNKTNGILSNLVDGSADMVVSIFSLNVPRFPYVKHLPMLTPKAPWIFIKRDLIADIEWAAFYEPFSSKLWIVIICTSTVIGSWLAFSNRSPNTVKGLNTPLQFKTNFSFNFADIDLERHRVFWLDLDGFVIQCWRETQG